MWSIEGQHSQHIQTPGHTGVQTTPQSQLNLFGLRGTWQLASTYHLSTMVHIFPLENLVNNLQREDCYSASVTHPCLSLWVQQLATQLATELLRSPSPNAAVLSAREKAKEWHCAWSSFPATQAHPYWHKFQTMPQQTMVLWFCCKT